MQVKKELTHHSITDEEEEITDPDVALEEERIGSNKIPSDSPIVLYKLRKIYKPKPGTPLKIAVKSFSFHVEKGECFGLLGPNGAGTTSIFHFPLLYLHQFFSDIPCFFS